MLKQTTAWDASAESELTPQSQRPFDLHHSAELRYSMRVLVVEDEEAIRQVLCMALEDEGHTVACVGNGREALDELDRQPFDLIVTNLMMPVMDGREFLRCYQQALSGPHCPVFVCSAVAHDCTAEELKQEGACCVLSKPFDIDRLETLVRECQILPGNRCDSDVTATSARP